MVSTIVLTLSAMLAVTAALVPGGAGGAWGAFSANTGVAWGPNAAARAPNAATNPWIPPWISAAPWFPQWGPCTMIGSTCLDCSTKMVCTKMGSLQKACSDPTMPHCNLGQCSATPSDECAVPEVPATTA